MTPTRPRRRLVGRLVACTVIALASASLAEAQQPLSLHAQATFYGDNTEFSNPFRGGETLLGAYSRLFLTARMGERVEISAGVFANQRFSGDASYEIVRPVLSLAVGRRSNRFVFGTLRTADRTWIGPDRGTLHGLVPALQVETLRFTRSQEAGLQWIVDTPRLEQDAWINWQKLNTPAHRELFDAGFVSRFHVKGPFSGGVQMHLVHHGGQLFANGAVSDSLAYGPGIIASGPLGRIGRVTGELYGFLSHYTPDRQQRNRIFGQAFFARAAAERGPWRGHIIVFRGFDFLKEEGDPNYLSIRSNGVRFKRVRDYAEIGGTRTFRPADGVDLEAAVRFHRTEDHYEYSYRILANVRLEFVLLR
jgi:hypothetical protein